MIDIKKYAAEFARALRNHRYEAAENGIHLCDSRVFIGGALTARDYRDMSTQVMAIEANTLLYQGLNHMLGVTLPPTGGYPQVAQWYIAPFSGNYTPDPNHTAADLPGAAQEFTQYAGNQRLALTISAAPTARVVGNTGNEALLTFNTQGPHDIYGVFVVSAAAKSAASGKALAAVRLANPRLGFTENDKLGLEYGLSATDAG